MQPHGAHTYKYASVVVSVRVKYTFVVIQREFACLRILVRIFSASLFLGPIDAMPYQCIQYINAYVYIHSCTYAYSPRRASGRPVHTLTGIKRHAM
jgi:hypothetical protein